MTEQEILEGNRLIAEFMGVCKNEIDSNYYQFKDNEAPIWNSKIHHKSKLYYHLSWDWLIPVIIKQDKSTVIIDNSIITFINKIGIVKRNVIRLDLNKTWESVVEFIKWHNNQVK